MKRTVRELEVPDIDLMINYFLQADPAFLKGMGAEPSKFPSAAEWRQILLEDLKRPLEQKKFYYVIWEIDDVPIGHSNINKIIYGQEAYMHLHLWKPKKRRSGQGTYFVEASIGCYFEKFRLKTLYCEPYALNPAPNRTLPKVGFELVKTYITTPGWVNFEQSVKQWILSREKWLQQSNIVCHL